MRIWWIGLATLALNGCIDPEIKAAEDNIKSRQKDAASAQFRNVEKCPKSTIYVTGEVNGKNGYGAYAGFKRFYANEYTVHLDGNADFDTSKFRDPSVFDMINDEIARADKQFAAECFGSPPNRPPADSS